MTSIDSTEDKLSLRVLRNDSISNPKSGIQKRVRVCDLSRRCLQLRTEEWGALQIWWWHMPKSGSMQSRLSLYDKFAMEIELVEICSRKSAAYWCVPCNCGYMYFCHWRPVHRPCFSLCFCRSFNKVHKISSNFNLSRDIWKCSLNILQMAANHLLHTFYRREFVQMLGFLLP